MVVCLERGADLRTAQLIPLPLTVSCFSRIQIGFTFLVPAHPGSPWPLTARVCVCSDVLCGQLHCTRPPDVTFPRSFLSSMVYLSIDSYITVGPARYDCDSAIIDVGTQHADPAMAPDGAQCADGKVFIYLFIYFLKLII